MKVLFGRQIQFRITIPHSEYWGSFLIPELYRSFTVVSFLCWEKYCEWWEKKSHHCGCVPIWFRFYGNEMTLKWLQKIMDPRAVGDKRAVCFWNVAIFVWRGDRSEAPGKKNLIWTQGKVVKIHGLESRFPGPLLFGSIRAKKQTAAFRCFE